MMHGSWLRQPFLYFMLGALAIFGIDALRRGGEDTSTIRVSEADIARLASGWERTWGNKPTPRELEGLIDDRIEEEIYVRQAEALGLGEDDPLIRKYLRRKMELLTEGVVTVPEPEEGELQAYFDQHADRFSAEPRISFQQALIEEQADVDVQALADALDTGADANGVGAIAASAGMQDTDRFNISRAYGVSFYDALLRIEPGGWQGPVASSVGVHLVKIETRQGRTSASFEDVKPDVYAAWRADKRAQLESEAFERLKNLYTVTVEPVAQ